MRFIVRGPSANWCDPFRVGKKTKKNMGGPVTGGGGPPSGRLPPAIVVTGLRPEKLIPAASRRPGPLPGVELGFGFLPVLFILALGPAALDPDAVGQVGDGDVGQRDRGGRDCGGDAASGLGTARL